LAKWFIRHAFFLKKQRLLLSADKEFETVPLSLVNGQAKLGKTFVSANQALIVFSGCFATCISSFISL